jgi:hypothetical protein
MHHNEKHLRNTMNTLHWRMPLMMLALLALTACAGCKEEKDVQPVDDFPYREVEYDLVLWNKLDHVPVVNMPVVLTESSSGITFSHRPVEFDTSDSNGRIKKMFVKKTIWRNGLILNSYNHNEYAPSDTVFLFKYENAQKYEFKDGDYSKIRWTYTDTIFVKLSNTVRIEIDSLFTNQRFCISVKQWKSCIQDTLNNWTYAQKYQDIYLDRYTQYNITAQIVEGQNVKQSETLLFTTGKKNSFVWVKLTNKTKTKTKN